MQQLMWQPSRERVATANLTQFMALVRSRHGIEARDYAQLYDWSISQPEQFWSTLWDYTGVIGERGEGPVLIDAERMPGARWFAAAKLNFAQNLLRRRDDTPALIFRGEDRVRSAMTHAEL